MVLQEFFLQSLQLEKKRKFIHLGYLKLSVIFQISHHQALNEEVRFVLFKLGEDEPFGFTFLKWPKYSTSLL